MTKYGVVAAMFLLNNEIISLIALAIIGLLFLADIMKARVSE